MLLSRVADALYWISRYLERADHTARVVDVAVDLGLGRQSRFTAIDRLYGSLGVDGVDASSATAAERAFFDAGSGSSVLACVVAARENARQVREEISTDMWEQLNALFLRLRRMSQDPARTGRTHYVARAVTEGVHLFQGITDATMTHGEGWQYIELGRYIERTSATAALLDVHYRDFVGRGDQPAEVGEYVEWAGLLRSCCAFEAYCRHYTADLRSIRIAEFLILNADFPRSIRFGASRIQASLKAIAALTGRGGRAERLAGRLLASLDYGQVDEIVGEQLPQYLEGIVRQANQINAAVYQQYIHYPIDAALSA